MCSSRVWDFFSFLLRTTTDVESVVVAKLSPNSILESALAIESITAKSSVWAWQLMLATSMMIQITNLPIRSIQRIHDALQLFFVIKLNANLSFSLGRTSHLDLCLEELGQAVAKYIELLGQLLS